MRSFRTVAVMTLVLLICFPILANEKSKKFKEAFAAAEANVRTPEGKLYGEKTEREFSQKHAAAAQRCRGLSRKEIESFDVLIRTGRDGSVEELLTRPETKAASCLFQGALTDKFTPPPKPSYWVRFNITVTK